MQMLEGILREIEEMSYPPEGIGCGLEDAGITDRYAAAAYGFGEAQERITDIIRSQMGHGGWIPCEDGLPEEPAGGMRGLDSLDEYIVMIRDADIPTSLRYAGKGEWYDAATDCFYPVVAWQPYPAPYRPKHKAVGEDFKGHVMGRFLKIG